MPLYVDRGGEQSIRHPIELSGATLQGFILDADRSALQALLDRYVNLPSGGVLSYHVLAPRVLLAYATMARAQSLDPVDRNLGWTPEIDVAFWIPAITLRGGLPHLAWFLPYIYVDSSYAMAIGRESFGFHKQVSEMGFTGPLPAGDTLTVRAMAAAQHGPDARFQVQKVLEAKRTATRAPAATTWASTGDALGDILGNLIGGAATISIPALGLEWNPLDHLLAEVPLLFLKEFRDATTPNQACYQAIIEAPARATNFRGGGLLDEDWTIEVPALASHPMVSDLGLGSSLVPGKHPFWVDFDFVMEEGTEIWRGGAADATPPARVEKVAILGGGMAGLSAAFAMTSEPGWQNHVDLTVYQQGWRLGGKGASGRNQAESQRIEEHGLHIWLGFYDNAFSLIRQCYQELGRPSGAPLATWDLAFKPHDLVVLEERVGAEWRPWSIRFPRVPGTPGDRPRLFTAEQYVREMLETMRQLFHSFCDDTGWSPSEWPPLDNLPALVTAIIHDIPRAFGAAQAARRMFDKVLDFGARWLAAEDAERGGYGEALLGLLGRFTDWFKRLAGQAVEGDDTLRRAYILLDLMGAAVRGIVVDDIPVRGWDSINGEDMADWLTRHGAAPLTTGSAVIRGIYQLVFAYPDGDTSKPGRFAAGTAVRGLLRMVYGYHGGIFWRMQAGMGETVFAPLYQVLKARGVKFEFFHRVDALRLSADKQTVASVELTRQATLVNPADGYDPLTVNGDLPCWPSRPHLGQLVEQAALANVDSESPWDAWPGVGAVTLRAGVDFDRVVLGIPVAGLKTVCADLCAHNPRLHDAVHQAGTVQTLAMQLWLTPALPALGWPGDSPVMDGYADPFNTWADMSHLVAREGWAVPPGSNAYFCGPLDQPAPIPPTSDHGFQGRELARVRQLAARWLDANIGTLWPRAVLPGGGFDTSLLADPHGGVGAARLDAQYFRANVSPSERYSLSLPGTMQYRVSAGEAGFANLVLAGDWIKTGIDAGCIEAAVMSGMQASRVICGWPKTIPGNDE